MRRFAGLIAAALALLALPVLLLAPGLFMTAPVAAARFSWPWYVTAIGAGLRLGAATAVTAVVLGTFVAQRLRNGARAPRPAIPAVVIVLGAALYLAVLRGGVATAFSGAVIADTLLAAPFTTLIALDALGRCERAQMRAAASLGVSPFAAFRRVRLPAVAPGLGWAVLVAFAIGFGDAVSLAALGEGARLFIAPTVCAAALGLMVIAVVPRLRRPV